MNWKLPFACLVVILLIGTAMTVLSFQQQPTNTIAVELGIAPSETESLKAIDIASQKAYERRQFTGELKQRLAKPHRSVELSAFYADSCEVSQREWEEFVDWTTSQPGFDNTTPQDWLESKSTGHRIAGRLSSPASGIDFKGATAYCVAANGRLPFAEEFEAMASGKAGRLYPWGDEFHATAWPYNSSERNASQSCNSHPTTSTPEGIHDLASNAMEWGQAPMYSQSPTFKPSIHGAPAARSSSRELYALNSAWLLSDPELKSNHLGFRCVYGERPIVLPWKRRIQDVVLVSGGEYKIGLPSEARLPLFLATMPPLRDVNLNSLLRNQGDLATEISVDRCEVTRASFKSFLEDPLVKVGMFSNESQPADIDFTPLMWHSQLEDETLPVFGVNWWAADAYARWVGGRLPTVEEWRQISAGDKGLVYPWGMTYARDAAHNGDNITGALSLCASANADETASGIADLGGNLSEWTRSLAAQNSGLAMWVQGGNWLLPGYETAKSLFGRPVPLNHRSKSIGFRVVYD